MSPLFGGLLSGTSLDGIDAAVLEVEGDGPVPAGWRLRAFTTVPWAPRLRDELRRAMAPGGADAGELARLHVAVGEAFADAFVALLDTEGIPGGSVRALGSHGQTFWHEPPQEGRRGWTLQLGDPATLAEATGIPVVSDFRARDMAAGGEGAPLVPWADHLLLSRPGQGRALQNLGGMGNVTWLPADGSPEQVLAFDTGPGVALLDGAVRRATGGRALWDAEGRRAARGRVQEELLEGLLSDPFFAEPPPRSTGRERFGEPRLEAIVGALETRGPLDDGGWDDLLATLAELTALSMARAYRDFLPVAEVDEVVLAGGGARNAHLVRRIEAALTRELPARRSPLPVRTGSGALGINPDAREVAAFALLAWAHVQGVPGNLPSATGAAGPRVLGSLTPGSR